MSLKSRYKKDQSKVKDGQQFDFGDALLTLRYSGKGNKKFQAAVAKAMKPFTLQIQSGKLNNSDADKLNLAVCKVFVQHIIVDWQTRRTDGSLATGLENDGDVDGELLPFNQENAVSFLLNPDYEDFYEAVQQVSQDRGHYLAETEALKGN